MFYKITDACIACGACSAACSFDAIFKGSPFYSISEEMCIGCGTCAELCPQKAIALVEDFIV
ncbi:MAG: 4Fe-4S binding protein [Oscillospiraceae bacterium]